MTIVLAQAFCITLQGDLGITDGQSHASLAWNISDDTFDKVLGTKFSWIDAEGLSQVGHKAFFRRPTAEEIKEKITPELMEIAVMMGVIIKDEIKQDGSEIDKAAKGRVE